MRQWYAVPSPGLRVRVMDRFVPPAIQFFVHALKEQLVRTDGEACDSAAQRDLFLKTHQSQLLNPSHSQLSTMLHKVTTIQLILKASLDKD